MGLLIGFALHHSDPELMLSMALKWVTQPGLDLQYIPRNMHMVFALLCFVVVIHWLICPYPSGLLHWHCGNLTIAPVPAKHPWWLWINTSCEFIMNDCITTTKQSTTKPCAYFLVYTVVMWPEYGRWHAASAVTVQKTRNDARSHAISPHIHLICDPREIWVRF